MDKVQLKIAPVDGDADAELADELRRDLDEHVGPTDFREVPAGEGEKGALGMDVATLMVAVLGTPALTALVGVLKSYFDRDRMTEIEISTARGSFRLRRPAGSALAESDIRRALDAVLGTE